MGSTNLSSLRRLSLAMCTAGDAGCTAIVKSGILARLVELALRDGKITDKGAKTLAASTDLGHLEKLVLSGNRLTDTGVAALQTAAPGAIIAAGGQQTSTRKRDHLYRGSWE